MTECTNLEIRDLLPDLLNERLDEQEGARVEAHLKACSACTAELELLRAVRRTMLAPVVGDIQIARIAAGIPAYEPVPSFSVARWRAAAAIAIVVIGAGGMMLRTLRDEQPRRGSSGVASATHESPAIQAPGPSKAGSLLVSNSMKETTSTRGPRRHAGLTLGVNVSRLSSDRLARLLKDLDKLRAEPSADPEAGLPSIAFTGGN